MNFLTLLPLLLQGATALTPLISALSPTLAAGLSATTSTAGSTTASKAALAVATAGVAAAKPPVAAANPIVMLQEMLVAAGQAVDVDGELGPQTLGAIEQLLGIVPGSLLSTIVSEIISKLVPAAP